MRTVAFIITKSEIGGAQSWVSEIAKVIKKNCRLILITSDEGWLTKLDIFDDVKIISEIKSTFSLKALFKTVSFLKKNKVDIVIASSANAGLYSRLSKLFYSFRCIYVSHGWSCIYNGKSLRFLFCTIEKYLSYLTDIIWCISRSDELKAINIIGINKKKIITLLNSITPPPVRERVCFTGKILFLGRLSYPKRPDLIANVISKNNNYTLDIVGGGSDFFALSKYYENCPNISFLGEIHGFNQFKNYDIFVLTSESEGLPMSALEASCAGIPMILSDVGGCCEVIDNNGVLTKNTEEDVQRALELIVDNYNIYLDSANRNKDKFNINSVSEKYREIIFG